MVQLSPDSDAGKGRDAMRGVPAWPVPCSVLVGATSLGKILSFTLSHCPEKPFIATLRQVKIRDDPSAWKHKTSC